MRLRQFRNIPSRNISSQSASPIKQPAGIGKSADTRYLQSSTSDASGIQRTAGILSSAIIRRQQKADSRCLPSHSSRRRHIKNSRYCQISICRYRQTARQPGTAICRQLLMTDQKSIRRRQTGICRYRQITRQQGAAICWQQATSNQKQQVSPIHQSAGDYTSDGMQYQQRRST